MFTPRVTRGGRKLYMLKVNCQIDSQAIACKQNIVKKYDVLEKIASISHNVYGLSSTEVLDAMLERENLGSTGFGGGIAIPHCKVAGIESPLGVFISLDKAIEYNAIDDESVDLIFALISPANNGAAHLHALAEVSRLLRDEKSCAQLRGTDNADSIFALLSMNSELSAA